MQDNYFNYNLNALKRTQGNQREADYLLDGTWYEYYYRVSVFNRYQKDLKEESDKISKS